MRLREEFLQGGWGVGGGGVTFLNGAGLKIV